MTHNKENQMRKKAKRIGIAVGVLAIAAWAVTAYAAACSNCNGSGRTSMTCLQCKGTGRTNTMQCLTCGGTGWLKCSFCRGSGQR